MTNRVQDYRRKVLSSLAWQGSAQLLGQIVSWSSTILVIRLLDPGDYGLMAMATLFVGFVLLLADLGIGASIIQAESLDHDDYRAIQAFVTVFNGAAFALTLLGSPLIAAFFDEPALVPLLRTLSLNFLLLSLYVVPQSRLVRDLHFERKAKVDLVTSLVSAITALSFAYFGFGVWSLVAGTLAIHALRAIGFNTAVGDFVVPHFSMERGARFIRFGSVIVLDRMLWFAYANMDITIAGKMLGSEVLGFYSVALTLAAIPLDKVMPVLTQVAFPAVSRIQDDPERVRQNILRALRYGNLVFLPVFWGMAWVADDAIPILLGPEWQRVVIPFQFICLILPLKALAALLPPGLFGLGRPMVNVVNMVVSFVLLSIGFGVGAQWGMVGLAASWLFVYPVVFVIITTRALPVFGIKWSEALDAWHGGLVAALLMSIAVLTVQNLLVDLSPLLRLIISIITGVVTYVLAMVVIDRPVLTELRGVVSR